jgi:DNA-binding LacI/PurR family transcriptional regulator
VVQPAFAIGAEAAELLLRRIQGTEDSQSSTVRLPARLEVRASSGPRC